MLNLATSRALTAPRCTARLSVQHPRFRSRSQARLWHSPGAALVVSFIRSGVLQPACRTSLVGVRRHQRRPVMAQAGGQPPSLVDDADWEKLAQHLRQYDEQRETVIKRCRDVTKLSKQAIYSLHRGDTQKADQQIASAEGIARELLPIVEAEPTLRYGSYAGGIEEMVEACVFRTFLAEDRLLKSDELPLANVDEYLGGVLDFTGELNRYAVKCATAQDIPSVATCTALVDALMGEFLKFDFRNTGLRRKFDALKYTLKKLENTLYELSLAEATGRKLRQGEPEPPQETTPAKAMDTGTRDENDL